MELVVVNGASNISRSIIRGLTAAGNYRKVRLLDFRPFKSSVYAFQREMAQKGIEVEKHQANSGASLDLALEGADKVVYFTHNYTSMTSCKNNFLVGTSKLAKKHGVGSITAVCPVEHDMVYNEDDSSSWIEQRREAEQQALAANDKLTILNTDLVYGSEPTHMVHYMAQCALNGSIPSEFLFSEHANFSPVHHADVARAVAHAMEQPIHDQLKVRGEEKISITDFFKLVETASGKEVGSTEFSHSSFLKLGEMAEEFFVGITHDRNMRLLLQHFEDHQADCPCPGTDFWESSGLSREHNLRGFYQNHRYLEEDEAMQTPTFGHYKQVDLN